MESLLAPSGNAAFVRRIETLKSESPAQWGKMNPAQMLVHCQLPFRVAADEMKLKRGLIGMLLGGWAKKKFITGDAPFGRNSPTDPKFVVRDERDFGAERSKLIDVVQRFGETGPLTADPHPFFGPLTREEWDRLLSKHLDHHLRQFGA